MAKSAFTLALLLALANAQAQEIRVADDEGRELRLTGPAARIVSLAPHATELLFAAGAGERVVGVAAYSDFPPRAASLPRIGDAHALDLERILSLAPDLVVAWGSGNNRSQVDKLRQAGVAVFVSEPGRAEDVATNLERLGRLAGSETAAREQAQRFRGELAALRATYSGRRPIKVFYEIWHEPPMTLNGRHFVSDLLAACGARNVFADLPALVPSVSPEAVIAGAPEAIVSGAGREALAAWRRHRQIPAARLGNLCAVDPVVMHRAGPRVLGEAARLCACLEAARRRLPSGPAP